MHRQLATSNSRRDLSAVYPQHPRGFDLRNGEGVDCVMRHWCDPLTLCATRIAPIAFEC
jgi:hypothetical protein